MSDLYYGLAIISGILLMIWCVTYKNQPRSVSANKPKREDPRTPKEDEEDD